MKRVRWNGELQWDDGEGGVLRSDPTGLLETDYRGFEWREVEGTEYVPETGEIRLVLKPVKKSFAEEMADFFKERWPDAWDRKPCGSFLEPAIAAVKRELANPAKPPRYTDEAVDEFLDAVSMRNKNGTTFYLSWLDEPKYSLVESGSERLWDAFRALKKQREAAQ